MLELTGKHILLLLLYSPGKTTDINEPILGRTRIIKMMFLFDKEIRKNFLKDSHAELISFPEFFPWHYGPFSKDVYNDIDFFINNGFIEDIYLDSEKTEIELDEDENWSEDYLFEDEEEMLSDFRNQEYLKLTEKGIKFVEEKIYNHLTDNDKMIIIRFKESINNASLEAILRYTYIKYPEETEKSKIKERFLGNQ
ncbi:MAG: hypothetical protein ACM3SY_15290 [Candidatus Omnitrophota bacterium]